MKHKYFYFLILFVFLTGCQRHKTVVIETTLFTPESCKKSCIQSETKFTTLSDLVNSNPKGLQFVYISPDKNSNSAISNSFWITKFEVTQKQYKAVMGENPGSTVGDDLPVDNIDLPKALLFCNRLSVACGLEPVYSVYHRKVEFQNLENVFSPANIYSFCIDVSANGFRLSVEAQWEYACRAGADTQLYFSNYWRLEDVNDYMWYSRNTDYEMQKVGMKIPNQWGLYDMHGNVSEWCHKYMSLTPDTIYSSSNLLAKGGNIYSRAKDCQVDKAIGYGLLPENGFGLRIILLSN